MTSELNNIQINEIARICHAANTALQVVQGDPNPSKPWDELDDQMRVSIIKGVRLALTGATAEQMHESWRLQKIEDGWTLDSVKDVEKKTHPNLVYYEHLPLNEKLKDFIFMGIVEGYAAAHGLGAKGVEAKHPVGEMHFTQNINSPAALNAKQIHEGTRRQIENAKHGGTPLETKVYQDTLLQIPLRDTIEFVQLQGYVVQEQADYDSMVDVKEINHYNAPVTINHNTHYVQPLEGEVSEVPAVTLDDFGTVALLAELDKRQIPRSGE